MRIFAKIFINKFQKIMRTFRLKGGLLPTIFKTFWLKYGQIWGVTKPDITAKTVVFGIILVIYLIVLYQLCAIFGTLYINV